VLLKGEDVTALSVHERAALGLGRTFQNVGLVKGSTVRENLLTAQFLAADYSILAGMLGAPPTFAVERELNDRAEAIVDIMGLHDVLDQYVVGLPYGVLKRVEIATVLATDPEVLLLDEPSSGMGPEEAHTLGDTLLRLRRDFGLSIAMIEHHVPLVVRVCDYVYCLNFGQLLAEGLPEEVRNHPQVITAYLGEDAEDPALRAVEGQIESLLDAD
jgi:branched-chain amino acid transport system ATP-binding protein